jgi:hypothetical protein
MEFTASLTIACSPYNVPSGQVRDIIIKAFRNHPEDRQTDAYILVVAALVEAMPCGQAKVLRMRPAALSHEARRLATSASLGNII